MTVSYAAFVPPLHRDEEEGIWVGGLFWDGRANSLAEQAKGPLLEPTEITPTGRRMFDEKIIERIKLIKKLNKSGYPLRAIRELFLEGRTNSKGSKK